MGHGLPKAAHEGGKQMFGPWKAVILALAVGVNSFAAEYKPGEVIVKYKPGTVKTKEVTNKLYDFVGVRKVKRFTGMMKGFEHLFLKKNIKVQDAIADLMRNPMVEYAQPNYILRINPNKPKDDNPEMPPMGGIPCIPGLDIPGCDPNAKIPCLIPGIPFPPGCSDDPNPVPTPTPTDSPGPVPTPTPTPPPSGDPAVQDPPADVDPPVADPDNSKAYGLEKIGATEAWKEFRGDRKMIVAVIDTGIDYNHEDLSFNVWRNPNPTKNDITGYDFIHNDGMPYDDHGHGTHCAGTIGAVGGNGKGVSGVNPRVSVMGLKFLSAQGSGSTADAIKSIDYAVEHGAKVLSNSWGGGADEGNKALYESIERAKAKDVLFIAAAGNESNDNDGANPSYPAAFDNDNLIAVAATDQSDAMAYFSNYGKKTVHVGAPGVNIYSLAPKNKYQKMSGTSMACPHVAGAAAFVWSKNPQWNYKKVKQVIMDTADPVSSLKDKTITGARINVLKALRFKD